VGCPILAHSGAGQTHTRYAQIGNFALKESKIQEGGMPAPLIIVTMMDDDGVLKKPAHPLHEPATLAFIQIGG
jgi:hypothetical protein